ncbi:unnamed protein product [Rotaria sp. Silwood1]|nr:unnamed protein product [Rotaria sp. Silwood1]
MFVLFFIICYHFDASESNHNFITLTQKVPIGSSDISNSITVNHLSTNCDILSSNSITVNHLSTDCDILSSNSPPPPPIPPRIAKTILLDQ